MRATAVVAVDHHHEGSRYRTLRSDPPLLLRPADDALQLVGGAAGPLGGDRLGYAIHVGSDAGLVVRSVAASMALPGTAPSTVEISATLGPRASLDWAPEPLISVAASDHRQRTVIHLGADATLRWREILVLGRTDEGPGSLTTVLRVERNGHPLTHQELRIGDRARGWDGPAGLAGATVTITEMVVGIGNHETRVSHHGACRAGVLEVAPDASLRLSLGPDLISADRLLTRLVDGDGTAGSPGPE